MVNQTDGYKHYVVNTSASVVINNRMGYNRYEIIPNVGSVLTIVHFNDSTDVIDLSAFPMYMQFRQLLITEGSVIVSLPSEQKVHILNLHPSNVSAANFVLFEDAEVSDGSVKDTMALSAVAAALIAGGGLVFGLFCVLMYCGGSVIFKEDKSLLKDHFLMEIKLTVNGSPIAGSQSGDDDKEQSASSGCGISPVMSDALNLKSNSVCNTISGQQSEKELQSNDSSAT